MSIFSNHDYGPVTFHLMVWLKAGLRQIMENLEFPIHYVIWASSSPSFQTLFILFSDYIVEKDHNPQLLSSHDECVCNIIR